MELLTLSSWIDVHAIDGILVHNYGITYASWSLGYPPRGVTGVYPYTGLGLGPHTEGT